MTTSQVDETLNAVDEKKMEKAELLVNAHLLWRILRVILLNRQRPKHMF